MSDAGVMPVLHLDGFDGPIDRLLDLAERQHIDLGRVSAAALAEQFVVATERLAATVPVERRAAWLVMAARLVLLCSLLLHPVDEVPADGDPPLRHPDALRTIRAASVWLATRPMLGVDTFRRARAADRPEGGYVALMEACLAVLRGHIRPGQAGEPYHPAMADLWRVPDALARIRAMLAEHPDGALLRFVPRLAHGEEQLALRTRAAVASTFVAGLELARARSVEVSQDEAFGPIRLRATG